MKRAACFAALAMLTTLAGCGRDSRAVPDENDAYPGEKMVGYREKSRGESVEFDMPEFPGVKFKLDEDGLNVLAIADGAEKGLYWGMPVIDVYLADLNGDGKREICSTAAMGSGIVDERVYAYDFANERLYTLCGRFECDYRLELRGDVLFYVKSETFSGGETLSEPLTLDKMKEVDKSEI